MCCGLTEKPHDDPKGKLHFPNVWGRSCDTSRDNLCSARVDGFDSSRNNLMMTERLDLLDECQEAVTIRLAEYQQNLAQCYNRDVKIREFSVGDLVLRRSVGNMRDTNAGKLAPTWEEIGRASCRERV